MPEHSSEQEIREWMKRFEDRLDSLQRRIESMERGRGELKADSPAQAEEPAKPQPVDWKTGAGLWDDTSPEGPPAREIDEIAGEIPEFEESADTTKEPVSVDGMEEAVAVSEKALEESKPQAPPPFVARTPQPLYGVEEQERAESEVKMGFDWRETLSKLGLVPPSGDSSLEIQIGTWWLSRIGAALLVLAVVFFAVWVAQGMPPWVKFCELAGSAVAVAGLGLWLERKLPRYGAVLFGAGLSLIYFSAFAAYAIPPVKIITSVSWAASVQFGVVIAILACALWRGSKTIALMSIVCAYLACLFSAYEGMNDYALRAALALGCGGAIFYYLRKNWWGPVLAAIPFTYAIYAVVLVRGWIQGGAAPSYEVTQMYSLSYMVLFAVADLVAVARGAQMPRVERRVMQILNTSLAVVLGLITGAVLFSDELHTFYFLFGAVMIGGVFACYLMRHPDAVMHAYFVKGTALITMGVIDVTGGRTRWIALAVQSFVLLLSAARSRLKIVEGAMVVVWLLSLGFFVDDFETYLFGRDS